MSQPTIGILGGMGPRATNEFERRLLTKLAGGDQALPRIISINDGTVPDRTAFLLGKGNDPFDRLIDNARLLKNAEVTIVCMPCNTAHSSKILTKLQDAIALPIIDMPAAVLACAQKMNCQKVLILATEGTIISRVYDERTSNIECRRLSLANQAVINSLIAMIKQGETVASSSIKQLEAIIDKSGCCAAVLACTELSLVANQLQTRVPVIDSQEILADRCVEVINEYNGNQL